MKCLICKTTEADKTGSHIIPHFILVSNVNAGKSKGRDKEESFQIDALNTNFFFGKSVLPETLERLFGRPINDDDIENNRHHYVRDYIFCSSCEGKFSVLESLYVSDVNKSIISNKSLTIDQLKISNFFWLSVILRCSVTNFGDFQLEKDIEQQVSSFVNKILAAKPEDLRANCLIIPFPFKLCTFTNTTLEDKTRNSVVLIPSGKGPYVLFINEYLLVFEFSNISEVIDIILGMGLINSNPLYDKSLNYLDNSNWEKVIKFCFQVVAKQFKLAQIDRFTKAFHSNNSYLPAQSLVQSFLYELIMDESVDKVTQYSEKRIQSLIEKYIQT